ncbi:leucyl aminopeptidase [Agromyces marinus]|uniref:Probable cytosol aminopeptidase n=1 Tax=Agromyces marinus TaxID=1389020 RepID=A0ABN6YF46_9MICO|nr:leucyl aminopeptidase [Agromyces marinus]UIP57248.1 Cytosol aminopeptidase [Agromyces marinus]BDZ54661.1 putative cytosol aminopeptidase [Agromyces marinus]
MVRNPVKVIPEGFSPIPSLEAHDGVVASVVGEFGAGLDAVGVLVHDAGPLPDGVGFDRDGLARLGFEAKPGQTLALPQPGGSLTVLVGGGDADETTDAALRDAAATFVRAAPKAAAVGFQVPSTGEADAAAAGRALVEGVLLGRYRYDALKAEAREPRLERVELRIDGADRAAASAGAAEGVVSARATAIARDLANTPPSHLTATDLADVAETLGGRFGFEVEVFDRERLVELGCGGILGVNAASAEEPRMLVLRYAPDGDATGHLGLVGKGIMYDSGGISLKPSDPSHLLMKMDMGGAAAVLGALTALRDLGARSKVSAWLMCTDNMPSGSAYKLGDVLTARGGRTVEVKNTDAEGRLVLMDGLVLATEAGVDAIVDIATLTGTAMRALGESHSVVLGTSQALIDRLVASGQATDELTWQFPLVKKYRKQLDSDVADIANIGGPNAGATTAALFLAEFVGETPWAHLDIAGTMASEGDDSWRSKGATGYGARLLLDLARGFAPVG